MGRARLSLASLVLSAALAAATRLPVFASGEAAAPAAAGPPLASPAECIALALERNLDLRVRFFEARSAGARLEAERAGFDPFAEFSAAFLSRKTEPQDPEAPETAPASAATSEARVPAAAGRPGLEPLSFRAGGGETDSANYEGRVVQPLPTGGEVALSANSDQAAGSVSSGADQAVLALSLNQPLLRGFAYDAARIPLKRARIEADIGRLEVRRAVLDVARDVEAAYWELVAADRSLAIARAALGTARTLAEDAAARRESGLADRVEMIEAESARASREEAVIEAQRELEDRRDRLTALMGCLGSQPEPAFSLAAPPPPAALPAETEEETMARIRRELPDYRITLREADRARLDLDAAKGGLLPRLDLTFSATARGEGAGRSAAFRSARGGSDRELSAAVVLGLPLTFREERARVRAAALDAGAREAALARAEQDLRLRLRLARRAAATAPARIDATRSARLLAEERFQQTRALYNEGLAPLRDVLPAQDDMEQARLRELRARLDAAVAAVELARLDATLLRRNRIDWEPFAR